MNYQEQNKIIDYQKQNNMMDYQELNRVINEKERGLEMSLAFPVLMRKVYTWMALALAITGLTAYGVASSPGLMQAIFGSRMIFFGLIIAELALVWTVSGRLDKLSLSTATLLFVLYSVLNGVTMAAIFVVYTMTSIATTFFITAGTFGAMALVGYTTKTDLSKMGGILLMALIGLIIAGIINIFLHNSMFDLIISGIGVLIFVGLTAWDSKNIKRMLALAPDAGEQSQKIALMGALSLYLDFVNLFIHLLRFFGSRD